MKFLYSTQHSSDSAGSMLTSTCVWMTMHILTGDIGIPLNQEPRVEDSYLAMTAQNSKLGSTRSIYHITCRSCHLLPALSYLLLWLCSYWCISQVCKSWCVSFSKGCSHLSGLKCTSTGRGGVLHYWGKIQALNSSDHKRTWAGVRSLYLTLFQVNSHLTVSCIKNTLPVPTTDHLSSTTLWVSDQVKRQKYLSCHWLEKFPCLHSSVVICTPAQAIKHFSHIENTKSWNTCIVAKQMGTVINQIWCLEGASKRLSLWKQKLKWFSLYGDWLSPDSHRINWKTLNRAKAATTGMSSWIPFSMKVPTSKVPICLPSHFQTAQGQIVKGWVTFNGIS